ncbi:MAG: hypothetical protein WBG71_06840 [Leeuwenhoekiella sp.]
MNFLTKTVAGLTLLALILFFCHYFIIGGNLVMTSGISLVTCYIYLYLLTLGIVLAMHYLKGIMPAQVGYVFLMGIFVKMGFAVLLFPQLLAKETPKAEILGFLVPYLLFLLVEVVVIYKTLSEAP